MSTMIDTTRLSRDLYDRCADAVLHQHNQGATDPVAAAAEQLALECSDWSPEGVHMLRLTVATVGAEVLTGLAVGLAAAATTDLELLAAVTA